VELRAFVERAPPVVVGFGSMMGFDAEEKTRRVLDAVKNLDDPVVLMSGWAGLGQMELPSHVRVAGYVPHAWLFSRARCVVHHGGAGTTAAALRAGIPQTIVWHLGDQPMWGQRVERLGVGPRARNHAKADAAYLRASIERMLRDEAMRERARALGAQVAGEDGLGRARRAVEALFHARQRDGSSAEPPQLGGRVN
jgi:UDP:flavonoid glycosyltransferase YjiC (YdhE family)